ncbi:MAG: YlxR family protein [Clostridia bacterium]|nr:YlxR family protein [Clostridia bacterium]
MNKSTPTVTVKKKPERRCVGCNETKLKSELVRIVRSPQGEVSLDLTGKKSGRGAYICHSVACLKKARKARRISNALSCEIPDEVYDRLEAELGKEL